MSFADEMRRKSLEAQSNFAEKARAEEAKALALEESKRNNCIPDLKRDIQAAASNGRREYCIKYYKPLEKGIYYKESDLKLIEHINKIIEKIENLEVNSFLEMRLSTFDEYDMMRIAFIKAEPGLSLKLVGRLFIEVDAEDFSRRDYAICEQLTVVW